MLFDEPSSPPPPTPGRLEKSVKYLAWYYALAAVLDVFHQNQVRKDRGECETKASSDYWCINENLRGDIHQRTRDAWCGLTGLDHTFFPLNVDAVARLYFRIRKRGTDEIKAFDAEVRDAIRQGGPCRRHEDD